MGPEPHGREQIRMLREVVGQKSKVLRNIAIPTSKQLSADGGNLLDKAIGGGAVNTADIQDSMDARCASVGSLGGFHSVLRRGYRRPSNAQAITEGEPIANLPNLVSPDEPTHSINQK